MKRYNGEEVATYTQKQREWILERDGYQCMFHEKVDGKWIRCFRKTGLEVHHILPRGFASLHAPDRFEINGKENLITLCARCHKKVHPDMLAAQSAYGNDVHSYEEVFQERHELAVAGQPYWRTRYDWMFHLLVDKYNAQMEKPYPYNSWRTIGEWRKRRKEKKKK